MNYDKILVKIFIEEKTNSIRLKLGYIFDNKYKYSKYTNVKHYIENRYNDSLSYKESIRRMQYNIEIRPVCPICGTTLKFLGKPNSKGLYEKFCSHKCNGTYNLNAGSIENVEKMKHTKLERYGSVGYNNMYKGLETKLNKYSSKNNYNKIKETKLNLYSDAYYSNSEKMQQTKLDKYGNSSFVNSSKCKQTKLEKYNDENYNNKEKTKQTCLEKYGHPYPYNNVKGKQTKLEKYGDENYNNKNKSKQTCLEKYGVDSYSKTNNFKTYIKDNIDSINTKRNNTKRKNKSFNTSKPEEQTYILLKEKYPDVIRQYKSDVYPFCCDFYIPSLDLYIECQYGWTHGNKPYEGTEEDNIKLEQWKSKNTKYYNNAIYTWTDLDIRKRNIAKENKLNYKEFWNIQELNEWIIES